MRIIDYELIEHINILFHKKVVIYGCGEKSMQSS